MRIPTTLKIDGSRSPVTDSAVTPSFDESRKNAGGKWGGFFSRQCAAGDTRRLSRHLIWVFQFGSNLGQGSNYGLQDGTIMN